MSIAVPSPQTMFPQTSSAVQEAPQLSPEPHLESRQSNVDHNTGRPSNNQGRQNYNQKGRGFLNDRGDRRFEIHQILKVFALEDAHFLWCQSVRPN